MGQTLSEPVTTKSTSTCQNSFVKIGSSCMQGWRISILLSLHTKVELMFMTNMKSFLKNDWT